MRAKVVTVMRWYVQDEVNQEDSEQNEVDGMKKGAELGQMVQVNNSSALQTWQQQSSRSKSLQLSDNDCVRDVCVFLDCSRMLSIPASTSSQRCDVHCICCNLSATSESVSSRSLSMSASSLTTDCSAATPGASCCNCLPTDLRLWYSGDNAAKFRRAD